MVIALGAVGYFSIWLVMVLHFTILLFTIYIHSATRAMNGLCLLCTNELMLFLWFVIDYLEIIGLHYFLY